MNLAILTMLPHLLLTGQLIIKSLEGGIDGAELKAITTEVRELVMDIPELKAFIGLFDILVQVAGVSLPMLLGDKGKMLAAGLTEEQVNNAQAVAKLFDAVGKDLAIRGQAAAAAVTEDDIEGLT